MPKLKIDDLEKIKEKIKKSTVLREGGENKARVIVHMGTCGILSGARNVMDSLLKELEKNNVTDVIVKTTGCAGLCRKEPMITVELAGQPPIKYIEVNPKKMGEIFQQHVLGGKVVQEYALAHGSESTDKAQQ